MLEEIQEYIPHIVIYIGMSFLIQFIFNYWSKTSKALDFGLITRIGFQIVLIFLVYIIVEHYRNN